MRGRINRAGYWLVLLVAVAMYVIISMFGSKPPAITELFLILLCVPRFHDLGTSGWWVAIPLAIEVVGAIAAFTLFSMEQATVIAGA